MIMRLSPEQWADWQQHPVTEVFLRFLADFRRAKAEELARQILSGSILTTEQQIRQQEWQATLAEVQGLSLDDIQVFYSKAGEE